MDWLDLQRLATALIMPLSLGLFLGVIGFVMVWRVRWLGAAAMGLGVCLIWVCSLPIVSECLMTRLESDYPPWHASDCEHGDAIVVLGGAIQPIVEGDLYPRLHRGSDRLISAARLYHAGCAPWVVISTGARVLPPYRGSETSAMAEVLADLGVPSSAMLMEDQGRNTEGSAAFSRAFLHSKGVNRVLLVTSAWHLRRASALFEREGFAVVPAGADYRAFHACRGPSCWLPSVDALEASGLAIKEFIGYWVQADLRK